MKGSEIPKNIPQYNANNGTRETPFRFMTNMSPILCALFGESE